MFPKPALPAAANIELLEDDDELLEDDAELLEDKAAVGPLSVVVE